MSIDIPASSLNCVFCGKTKDWASTITIDLQGQSTKISVCPKCREKHSIAELYKQIARKLAEDVASQIQETLGR
jgi:hypothetical protein